jgi:hypothetical protein
VKIYGYKNDGLNPEEIVPAELAEITLVANSEELRKIAKFIVAAAEGIEKSGKSWEHEHLSDKFREFQNSPHFVVFNAAIENDL